MFDYNLDFMTLSKKYGNFIRKIEGRVIYPSMGRPKGLRHLKKYKIPVLPVGI